MPARAERAAWVANGDPLLGTPHDLAPRNVGALSARLVRDPFHPSFDARCPPEDVCAASCPRYFDKSSELGRACG